jgi:3-deoxy-7-phosphoheptulonate synthase
MFHKSNKYVRIDAIHNFVRPPSQGILTDWNPNSWRSKKSLQLPRYSNPQDLDFVFKLLERYPPLLFAGKDKKIEERLGEATLGNAFLLQGGDCANSFKEFNANNIHYTFRVLL